MEIFGFTLKKSRLAGMLLAIFLAAVCSVAASASYPLVRNYTRSAYHGGTQNWDIKQDSYGRMLFANNSGMLIYDSKNWTLCPIGNYTSVRSLMVDEARRASMPADRRNSATTTTTPTGDASFIKV